MDYIYMVVSGILLPRLKHLKHLQGATYPFVGISCLYGIWMLANGIYIELNSVNIAVFSFLLWIIVSILWTEKKYAILEIFTWISYFILFIASQTLNKEFVMIIMCINPLILSIHQIYLTIRKADNRFPLFYNSNWNSSFLLIGFYTSMWCGNISFIFYILAIIIGVAIIASRCRGSIAGLFISLLIYIFQGNIIINLFIFIFLIGIVLFHAILINTRIFYKNNKRRRKSILKRWWIYKDVFKKIHPKWIRGRGMNFFRDTTYGRVHNDHLEIIGELGIVGYILFLNIFYQSNFSLTIMCLILSIFISGLFFFPLRETYIACPFWIILGANINPSVGSFITLKITGILSIIMIMIFVFTIYSNLLKSIMNKKE